MRLRTSASTRSPGRSAVCSNTRSLPALTGNEVPAMNDDPEPDPGCATCSAGSLAGNAGSASLACNTPAAATPANGPTALALPFTNKAQARRTTSDPGLHGGAGDGNRTRTISLGIKRVRPLSASPCYSCTSGPRACPTGTPESSPVRPVCETNVRGRPEMINLNNKFTTWGTCNSRT